MSEPGKDLYVEAETYTASVLPRDHRERAHFELELNRYGDKWAVRRYNGRWWDRKGDSQWLGRELRADEERERYLMTWAEAISVAQKVAPILRVAGVDVADVLKETAS